MHSSALFVSALTLQSLVHPLDSVGVDPPLLDSLGTSAAEEWVPDSSWMIWDEVWFDWCSEMSCVTVDTAIWNIRGFDSDGVPALNQEMIQNRMKVLDAETPLDFSWNPMVQDRIGFYASRRRNHLGEMLGRKEFYFPLFEEALDRYDLPLELKYLPIVESALNPVARSHAGATGLWQFMYGTAKFMGLRVDSYIDERKDPVRSTDAACRYLSRLHGMYGDWYLALAAYNAGPGNVNKAIRRSGGKQTYWEIRRWLPSETRGYVPAFMAVAYLMNFHAEHNIFPTDPLPSLSETDTIEVRAVMRFDQIASELPLSEASIARLNPMYRQNILPGPPEHWPLRLPLELVPSFLAFEQRMLNFESEKTPEIVFAPEPVVYRVKSGDVLGAIANRYGVSVQQLKEWNGITGSMIRVGQKLYIHADPSTL
jgi:membrane-bound lytic murein transglycosylase D